MATKRIAAIAVAALIGIAILFKVPGLGGFILGAALTAAIATPIVERRVENLRTAARELNQRRDQYNAALGTFTAQRRRILVDAEGRIAEHTARLNAKHNAELFQTQLACYEQGAIDALTGRLADFQEPREAAVISLASRLQRPRPGQPNR